MKNLRTIIAIVLWIGLSFTLLAQTDNASTETPQDIDKSPVIEAGQMDEMIARIGETIETKYITAEMGRKMSEYVKAKHQQGKYSGMTLLAFGKQLREDFIEVSGDVHMNAIYEEPREIPRKSLLANKVDSWGGPSNFGFVEFKISKNNIGYLRIGHFGKWEFFEQQKRTATNCMRMLENTNAIIVDVRGNPGGFEDIVAYVVSYFFDQEPFHLQRYYCRHEDRSRSIGVTNVPGKRRPDVPLYILVDKDTGSAAESFAYMMKHLKRATVVGEQTVGAGNGSSYFRIADRFNLQVATWETINAVTQTSWEKVGVKPDVETSSESALERASELAKTAGAEYRNGVNDRLKQMLEKLREAIENHPLANSDDVLISALTEAQNAGIYNESNINSLGYELLLESKKIETAEAVLKANTLFYPKSANVHDSYGEALVANGKQDEALRAFERAVAIAKESGDTSLPLFVDSLEKLKKQMN